MKRSASKSGWVRGAGIAAAVCLLLVAGLLVSLTVFLNGQGLRERIETALSHALGRPVRMDSLQFSLLTGSAVAHGLRIADDPRFGTEPFVQAADVRLGLALWPLLTRREVEIGSVELRRPQIRLLRDAAGVWNYGSFGASFGSRSTAAEQIATAAPGTRRHSSAALAVSRIEVVDGQVLVRVMSQERTQRRIASMTASTWRSRTSMVTAPFPFALRRGYPPAAQCRLLEALAPSAGKQPLRVP